MHRLIFALVPADSPEPALLQASRIFQSIVSSETNTADYWVTFDEEGSPAAGKGRWGDLPAIAATESKAGDQLLTRGKGVLEKSINGELTSTEFGVFYDETGSIIAGFDELEAELSKHENTDLWIIPADIHF